jgi:VanZ family protein
MRHAGTEMDRMTAPHQTSVISIARFAAWIVLITIVVLTFVPPSLRPTSGIPHLLEHFSAFLLVGGAFGLAYPDRAIAIAVVAVPLTAALELMQLLAPGRHARLADFLVNGIGVCVGIAIVACVTRRRHARSRLG